MKISTRLQLVGWFSAGVAVLTVALLFSAAQSVRQELAKNEAAGNVLQAVTALRYLSLEYVLHHAQRTRGQWQLRAASLDRLLTGSADFTDSDDPALLEQLRHTHASVDQLFSQLVANPAYADAAEGRRAVVDERESRLSGQISNKVQSMISDALELSERSRQGVLAAQQRQLGAVVVFGAAVVFVIAMNTLITLRRLVRPLEQIRQSTALVGAGVHGARADVLSRDELGQVAQEFNRMAQSIEDSHAKELATANDMRAKVDALLDVVSRAAKGDLTGTITIRGDDAIGRLGEGLATMLDDLRSLLDNVQRAGNQVTTSATQIAASAREQEATGIEQAQTTVEVLSTTREISANTSQLLRTMEEATEVADYTTAATAEAQDNLKRLDQSMQQMVTATDTISAKLATLSEKASNINSVLTTITKVADQTNILSLNAAIEAEKAGDAGRGFAVVASEIRRLADQTSVSTWDIEQMLKEMQSAVSASVMGMDKFTEDIRRSVDEARHMGEQLSGMTEQVSKLAPRFDLVLQGMQSQAVGASQITETMTQLSETSQQTVDSLKATSEAVHQLQYAATDLQQSVTTFAVTQ